jgi:deazaflavin-dependent oxidoreductase (nitroreductase family)
VAKALAGRRWFPIWGVMHHVGRRSGRQYAIPVALGPVVREDVFLIGLPWGPKTNWAQNVLADGRATVTWKGRDWAATNPRVITAEQAAALAKAPLRSLVGSGRFPAFIGLDR